MCCIFSLMPQVVGGWQLEIMRLLLYATSKGPSSSAKANCLLRKAVVRPNRAYMWQNPHKECKGALHCSIGLGKLKY